MVDVVLPTLNEARALPWVLGRMPVGFRPIVVDNGSTDGSAEVARALGAYVVPEPQRGFGAACWSGLQASTSTVVAFMDADASLDPGDLMVVCAPVLQGRTDLMLGARKAAPGAWPWPARQANRLVASRIRRQTGTAVSDLGPMRAVERQRLVNLGMTDRGFGWPLEMVLKAAAAGWRVDERPVPYHPRVGRSKVSGTIGGSLRAVRDMRRVFRDHERVPSSNVGQASS